MKNLAGNPRSTAFARQELDTAGIPFVVLDEPFGEPEAWVGGALGDFTFRRAWYYWVVNGPMPLVAAKALYADPIGRLDVRADGFAGGREPEDVAVWRDPDGIELVADPDGSEAAEWAELMKNPRLAPRHKCCHVPDPSQVPGARAFVELYHVDSAEGLRLIADTIRGLMIAAEAA